MPLIARICAFMVAVVLFCASQEIGARASAPATFSRAGDDAVSTLLGVLYAGDGLWRDCNQPACRQANSDWGADSATDTLYLRWTATHDPKVAAVMAQLARTARRYPAPCAGPGCPWWSDTPAWDAVTLMREYEVLDKDPDALERGIAAFRYVWDSKAFARGACPEIPYQLPQPSDSHVKTIETDANEIKAAILIYNATHDAQYLHDAVSRYAADREYYLDPGVALYSVHVIDDGVACEQADRRFFASVNGDMIWNGLQLSRITGEQHYYDEAIATARAVATNLSDERGVFIDIPGENDVVEPLVEAMYDLATSEHLTFARDWILTNASAALSARGADGTFSRYFDGPAQAATSVWESNGGLALEIAASAIEPDGAAQENPAAWQDARVLAERVTSLPATIAFDGSGIALVGTMSRSCESAHVRVFVDGVETFDHTGLWQNSSMPGGDSVLFAWRWSHLGKHTIRLEPGDSAENLDGAVDLRSIVPAH
jgi:hypothetical protein